MNDERVVIFECEQSQLVGVLHPSDGSTGVLIVVGGPQYRVGSHRQFVLLARALAKGGFPTCRFDYRGMGDSQGDTRDFSAVSADIMAALDAFFKEVPALRSVVLWGLCDGASAILMSRLDDSRIAGLILANPWVHTEAGEARAYLKSYYLKRILQRNFWRKILQGGFNFAVSIKDLGRAVRRSAASGTAQETAGKSSFIASMAKGMCSFAKPVLVLISERDLVASEFQSLCTSDSIWRATMSMPTVQVVKLSDADHTFSRRVTLEAATAICVEWLVRVRSS